MSGNFFNSSLNDNMNGFSRFNLFPERTMRQVKESAVNLLKNVVKPITDIGMGKEQILDGTVERQINSCSKLINSINLNMNAVDKNAYRSLDVNT